MSLKCDRIQPWTAELATLDQFQKYFIREYSKYFDDLLSGERSLPLGILVTIYGRDGRLGHVTQMPRTNFRSPYPRRLHIKFGFDRSAVSEKKTFEHCGRRTEGLTTDDADGRRTMGIL